MGTWGSLGVAECLPSAAFLLSRAAPRGLKARSGDIKHQG